MYDSSCLSSSLKIKDFVSNIKYRINFKRSNPDYFEPDGCIVFTGSQGSGKTISAVRYINNLCKLYPNVQLVSNCFLDLPNYNGREVLPYKGITELSKLDNGYKGIICFIDEIQSEFSSLESAKLHPSVLQIVSMQRKRRLHIVGTAQLLKRIAKPWREQLSAFIECSCIGGFLQVNAPVDFTSISEDDNGNVTNYKVRNRSYFFRSPALFNMYDTFERVRRVSSYTSR